MRLVALAIVLALGGCSRGPAAEAAARDAKNRQIVESAIGRVSDSEWGRATRDAQDSDPELLGHVILDLRAADAERENRRVIELALGHVTDAEWQRARAESTEPDHYVMPSQIIRYRFEQTRRQIDSDTATATSRIDAQSQKFQRDLDGIAAKTQADLDAWGKAHGYMKKSQP